MDKAIIQKRIDELKREYAASDGQLKAIQQQERNLQNTILKIKGAIEVLEELLQEQG